MANVLEAKNVSKVFGGGFLSREEENVAVNNISMSLDQKNPKIIARLMNYKVESDRGEPN